MTQKQRVLEYLKTHKSITALDGIRELGVIDLAGVIRNLKQAGVDIDSKWEVGFNRFREEIRYKRYFIKRKPLLDMLKEFIKED